MILTCLFPPCPLRVLPELFWAHWSAAPGIFPLRGDTGLHRHTHTAGAGDAVDAMWDLNSEPHSRAASSLTHRAISTAPQGLLRGLCFLLYGKN